MHVRSLVARSIAAGLPLFVLGILATGCVADPGDIESGAEEEEGTGAAQQAVDAVPVWTPHYGYVAGGWRLDKNPRFVADVNGDGYPDVVGFGNDGTYVSLSTGSALGDPQLWLHAYGYDANAGNWHMDRDLRFVTDVDNDGMADIVGFGDDGVYVSISTGEGFASPTLWLSHAFGYQPIAGSWHLDRDLRYLADVNGDGYPDLVGFGNAGVAVALGTGTAFQAPTVWLANFGYGVGAGQWRVDQHPRYVADVNGDGLADVVGFWNDGVKVALSTGTAFAAPTTWLANFYGYGSSAGNWRVDQNPRYLADVDGDGRSDIVGFGNGAIYVSHSTGTAFATPAAWLALSGATPGGGLGGYGGPGGGYGNPGGLGGYGNPGGLGGYGNPGGLGGYGNPGGLGGYGNPGGLGGLGGGLGGLGGGLGGLGGGLGGLGGGYGNPGGGYGGPGGLGSGTVAVPTTIDPRLLVDFDGDHRIDLLRFEVEGPYFAASTGSAFAKPSLLVNNFGTMEGWRADRHLRLAADMNHDGKMDIVGFGDDGVHVWLH
jgi:hypothetical protein